MPVGICNRCMKPCPDSFHDFKEICNCKTKQEWIDYYKKRKWYLKINGKKYDFTNSSATFTLKEVLEIINKMDDEHNVAIKDFKRRLKLKLKGEYKNGKIQKT